MLQFFLNQSDGNPIDIFDPDPNEFTPERIARKLSRLLRFNGDTCRPYSVGEHTLNLNLAVPGIATLLHDAAEGWLGDMPAPIKDYCPDFCQIDDIWTEAICRRYCISVSEMDDASLNEADRQLAIAERFILRNEDVTASMEMVQLVIIPQQSVEQDLLRLLRAHDAKLKGK